MKEQPRVTSLEPLDEDPCLVEVKIDGAVVGTAARDELDSSQAQIGMAADDPCVLVLRRSIKMRTTRSLAMGLISRCEFPRAGLTQRLIKHGIDETMAHDVVEEISLDGWIDDESYARRRLRSLREHEGHSSEECRKRLKAEWVDTAIVERLIAGEDRRQPEGE